MIREGKRTGQLQVRLVVAPGRFDLNTLIDAVECDGLLLTRTDAQAEVPSGGETVVLAGRERLEEELHSIRYKISAEAFFQTNTEMAEVLYGLVRDAAALEGWERLVDLYCGIGTIGLTLAPRAGESSGESSRFRRRSTMRWRLRSARATRIARASWWAMCAWPCRRCWSVASSRCVAVVDPPRAGSRRRWCARIVDAAPRRVVYVSCNPTTLAPNAKQLVEAGYELRSVQPVDMFPQTPHVEAVAVFERGPAA